MPSKGLTASQLTELSRKELVEYAKRNGVKANGKKADIIQRLQLKSPKRATRSSSKGNSPKSNSRKEEKVRRLRSNLSRIESRSLPKKMTPAHSTSTIHAIGGNSRNVPDDNGRSPLQPFPEPTVPLHTGNIAAQETEETTDEGSAKAVRKVQRSLMELINETSEIAAEIKETKNLLSKALAIETSVRKDMKHNIWMRYCLENELLSQVKDDRTLWDGTHVMPSGPQQRRWEAHLSQVTEEQERKAMEQWEILQREYKSKDTVTQHTQKRNASSRERSPRASRGKRARDEETDVNVHDKRARHD